MNKRQHRKSWKHITYFCIIFLFFSVSRSVFAGYYTLPIDVPIPSLISAFFDHDNAINNEVYYDGTSNHFYDQHHGTDFAASLGTDVLASNDGTVHHADWQNPNHTIGYGFYMALHHPVQNHCTVYAHLTANSNRFNVNDPVLRGEIIASSGNTGQSSGPHLHFGVYRNMSNCIPPLSVSNQIDPFGWSPLLNAPIQVDPWLNTQGYLWTTNPPSLPNNNPTLPITTVNGNITQNTTWSGGRVYLVNSAVVDLGVTLTINSGAVIKFDNYSSYLQVDGTLQAQGTAASPIYFTSYKDDSVGGDSNGDGNATSPAVRDFRGIINSYSGTINLENVVMRHGGAYFCGWVSCTPKGVIVNVNGGNINATSTLLYDNLLGIKSSRGIINLVNSTIASSTEAGIEAADSTDITIKGSTITRSGGTGISTFGYSNTSLNLSVSNSTVSGNGLGIHAQGGQNSLTDVSITNTNFVNNMEGDAVLAPGYQGTINFVNSSNTSAGTTKNGFYLDGHFDRAQTWNPGVPFVISGPLYSSSNSSFTINPGVIVKFASVSGRLVANGALNVFGASQQAPVYFTSYKDDSVGGDSNGDGSNSLPSEGDYQGVYVAGGPANIAGAEFRYGGAEECYWTCSTRGAVTNQSNIPVNISSSVFKNNRHGIYSAYTATTTVSKTSIMDSTNNGILAVNMSGGPIGLTIEKSLIVRSGSYGVYVMGQYGDHNISITNTRFENNEYGDGYFGAGYQTPIDLINFGNSTSGDTKKGFYLYGYAKENQTWNPGVPFIVDRFSTGNKNLTINPRTVIKFHNGGSYMQVGGDFLALGTPRNKIYFTSYADDTIGGDSNGDGWTTHPQVGDFGGIYLYGLQNIISNSIITYGGRCTGQYSCILRGVIMYGGQGTLLLDSNVISKNEHGIEHRSGTVTMRNNAIFGNTNSGLMNLWTGSTTAATNNWWGDANGPRHSNNPTGLGDQIYGNVIFAPWLPACNFEGCVTS